MNSDTLTDHTSLDAAATDATPKTRHWWNPFTRTDRPRAERTRRSWLGGRRRMMEEMREEQNRLVEALEKLSERLDASTTSSSSMEIDPMPVIQGIKDISSGQKEISEGLAGLSRHLERAEQTDERLTSAVTQVDKTLAGVRDTQADTASAIGQVGSRIEDVTGRFEDLFSKMQSNEAKMADDYRKLQSRTTLALAGIGVSVIVVLTVFMIAPWA